MANVFNVKVRSNEEFFRFMSALRNSDSKSRAIRTIVSRGENILEGDEKAFRENMRPDGNYTYIDDQGVYRYFDN